MSLVASVDQKRGYDAGSWGRIELRPSGSLFVDIYPEKKNAVFARGRVDAIEFLEWAVADPNLDMESSLELILQYQDGQPQVTDHSWMMLTTIYLEQKDEVFDNLPRVASEDEPAPVFIAIDGGDYAVSWERRARHGYSQTEITIQFKNQTTSANTETLSQYLAWTFPPSGDQEKFWEGVLELFNWSGPDFRQIMPEEVETRYFHNVETSRTPPDRLQASLIEATKRVHEGRGEVRIGPDRVGRAIATDDLDILIFANDTIEGEILREGIRLAQEHDTAWVVIESGEELGQAVDREDSIGLVGILEAGPANMELEMVLKSIRDANKDRSPFMITDNR